MNNKVVAMKENKLGVLGWFVKNTIGGKLNNIALAMIPKLSKEQALAVVEQRKFRCTFVPLFFNKLNPELRKDKEIVMASIKSAQFTEYQAEILKLEKANIRNDKEIIKNILSGANGFNLVKEIMNLAKFDAWNDKDLVKVALSKISGSDIIKLIEIAGNDAKKDNSIMILALSRLSISHYYSRHTNPTSFADIKKIMGLAADAWNDKDLVKIALSSVSGLANIKETMELADAWKDKDLVKIALSSVSTLEDVIAIMKLATFDFWNDKETVKVALSRVSGSDTVTILKLSGNDARIDKNTIETALSRVSTLEEIKAVMELTLFDSWNDKELIKIAINLNNNNNIWTKTEQNNQLDFIKGIMDLAKFDAWNDKELMTNVLNKISGPKSYSDTINALELAGNDIRNNKDIIALALNKVSDSPIVKIMELAGEDVRKDRQTVKLALSKVSKFKDIKAVMELALFNAWDDKEIIIIAINKEWKSLQFASETLRNDKEVVSTALNKVLGANVVETLELAGDDVRTDKDIETLALNRVSGSDAVRILELASDNARINKLFLKQVLNKVYTLADIKKTMELAKFNAWNDRELFDLVTNLICKKLSHLFFTKIIDSKSKTETKTSEGYYTGGYDGGANGPWEASEWVPGTKYNETTTSTTYGFDEAKADEFLKGFPQEVIDEVKKQLANKTRTETETTTN